MRILKETTQTLTDTFAPVGLIIGPESFAGTTGDDLINFSLMALGFKITFNDSSDFEVQAIPIDVEDSSEYELPIDTIKKTIVETNPLVKTRKGSTDGNPLFRFEIGSTIDALRIEVRVKTPGATPGEITRAVYNLGYIQ